MKKKLYSVSIVLVLSPFLLSCSSDPPNPDSFTDPIDYAIENEYNNRSAIDPFNAIPSSLVALMQKGDGYREFRRQTCYTRGIMETLGQFRAFCNKLGGSWKQLDNIKDAVKNGEVLAFGQKAGICYTQDHQGALFAAWLNHPGYSRTGHCSGLGTNVSGTWSIVYNVAAPEKGGSPYDSKYLGYIKEYYGFEYGLDSINNDHKLQAEKRAKAEKARAEVERRTREGSLMLDKSNRGMKVCRNVTYGNAGKFTQEGYIEDSTDSRIKIHIADAYRKLGTTIARPGGFEQSTIWDSPNNWYICE